MQDNNIMVNSENQEVGGVQFLEDRKLNGELRPWKEKKLKSLELAESYRRIGLENKFYGVHECGSVLEFTLQGDGSKKLTGMKSCKDRLCSSCAWRRELKIYSQLSQVIGAVDSDKRFLFLTLTCKNVLGEGLKEQIGKILKAYTAMFRLKKVDMAVKGWFRGLEVTHDVNRVITEAMYYGDSERRIKSRGRYYKSLGLKIGDANPNFNYFHPHIHAVLMVNKSYFVHDYVRQEEWTSLWQRSLKADYKPIVNVKAFKPGDGSGIIEAAKYTVKDSDYLVKNDLALTDETVSVLYPALAHRRLVAFGKEMKDLHKALNLTDPVDGDLVNTGDEPLNEVVKELVEVYRWSFGYSNYIKV